MPCLLLFACGGRSPYIVALILVALICSSALSLLPARWAPAALLAYAALCFEYEALLCFAPLIVYDSLALKRWPTALLLLPWMYHYDASRVLLCFAPLCLAPVAALLQLRTLRYEGASASLYTMADQLRETNLLHSAKSKALLEKQDYEIHLATLSERNRIARDIHDNVGHMLSRALLQTGALLCALSLGEEEKAELLQLKGTLSGAMDDVRQSVHNLYADSVDLHAQLRALAEGFTLCPVQLEYDVDAPPSPAIKYCFLAVAKEALSNVAKHALSPSLVTLRAREHPALYQLDIRDDGQPGAIAAEPVGLGLRSIEERVASLGGNVHFSREDGFHLFISIPKQNNE